MGTSVRSIRLVPPSPTLLPSATDNPWPPSLHKHHPHLRWYKSASKPHSCSTPESNRLAATEHCSILPRRTNSRFGRDDRPLCRNRYSQSHTLGSWHKNRPTAIDCSSPDSYPCKTPTHTRSWEWHRSRYPACHPS